MGDMAAELVPSVDATPPTGGSFEAWYRAAHPRLLAILIVASGDIEAARDAAAEAFTRALERWPRVHGMDAPRHGFTESGSTSCGAGADAGSSKNVCSADSAWSRCRRRRSHPRCGTPWRCFPSGSAKPWRSAICLA